MVVAVLSSILIILIAGVAPRRMPSLVRSGTCAILVVLIWLIVLHFTTPLELSYPDAASARVAKFAHERLKEEEQSLGQYVLVIEGSSPTSRAVDGDLLQTELRAAGISASVIQIALDGSNHLERLQILRQFVQGLDAKEVEQLKRSRVFLCREIEYYYDRDPFNKLEGNFFTDVALSYLNARNLPDIVHWFALSSGWNGLVRKRELVGSIAAMELFNLFRVGYFARVAKGGSLPPQNGFVPKETRSADFNPQGPLPLAFPKEPSKDDLKIYASIAGWVSARDREYAKLFAKIGGTEWFFSVTSWYPTMYRYNFWLADNSKKRPFFNGDTEPLRQKLADPDLWADEIHLRPAGARIFTQVFANYWIDAIKNHRL
ncbi:MAG: hypothetical protein JOZ08_07290 [Verrucomicrobia bacterium]|nr:hypothetical protein [Verrucomicrobiota bacterium]MBV8274407.1 hypothetical protein [Verrucomicrobiota bacterium]